MDRGSMSTFLRLHDIVPLSHVNGPGARFSIWLQGCSLACPACFNPETHDFELGTAITPFELAQQVLSRSNIEGVTISGGEPLQQADALIEFLRLIRAKSQLTVLIFSGFDESEISRLPIYDELKILCDVVVAGRYVEGKKLGRRLLGSSNQQLLFFSSVYDLTDFQEIAEAEVVINSDGSLSISGVDPLKLSWEGS